VLKCIRSSGTFHCEESGRPLGPGRDETVTVLVYVNPSLVWMIRV
jgi:hypothetical protein